MNGENTPGTRGARSAAIRDRSERARALLRGIAEGDFALQCQGGGWVRQPGTARERGREETRLVADLVGAGLLDLSGPAAKVTPRGLRYCGIAAKAAARPRRRAHPGAHEGRAGAVRQDADCPLEWLRARKGPDGQPMIGEAAYGAASRLRLDYMRAGLMPRVSADLEARPAGGRSGARGPGHVLDGALDARDRVNTALGAVGPEMSGMIVDVCCHMKSLAAVERERGWPKRSAKVVLDLGLARLARHYGLCEEARGRARPRGVRHWGAPGYRPDLE